MMKQVTYGLSANGLGMEVNGRFYPWGSVAASVAQVWDGDDLKEEDAPEELSAPESVDRQNINQLFRVFAKHEGRISTHEQYLNDLKEKLKALTLRVDSLHVEQAREGLEEEIERMAPLVVNKSDMPVYYSFGTSNTPSGKIEAMPEAGKSAFKYMQEVQGQTKSNLRDWCDARFKVIEQSISALQHAACETARLVLDKEESCIVTPDGRKFHVGRIDAGPEMGEADNA